MSEMNLDVVRSVIDAFDSGDFDQVLGAFDEGAELVEPDWLPLGGVYRGLPAIQEVLSRLTHGVNFVLETEWFGSTGDEVVQYGRLSGVVKATGESFSTGQVNVWRLREGKVISLHTFLDSRADVEALVRALED
jgi:uncharacterized protein